MRSNNSHHYSYVGRVVLLCVLLIIFFAISGCQSVKYVDRVVYVDRPVAIPCVTSVPIPPKWETTKLTKSDGIDHVSRAYMIEISQRKSHEASLEAIVNTCAGLGRPDSGSGGASLN
jgi:hypothetical protein